MTPVLVNDIHSQLNPTEVARIVPATSADVIRSEVRQAGLEGRAVAIAGARHSMGGQPFASDGILLDLTPMNKILHFDHGNGLLKVESGIQWPQLIDFLHRTREESEGRWGIAQKQTGADRLTLGGAVSANAHGRGLSMQPLIAQVEALTLMDSQGNSHRCSRESEPELFRLAIGGYGLFGVITSITLRLVRRTVVRRVVIMQSIEGLIKAFNSRIADGFTHGDCQFDIDDQSVTFLREGVFSCYVPVGAETPIPNGQKFLRKDDWRELLYLAHADKRKGFDRYSSYYLSTSGQLYDSDRFQQNIYLDHYHVDLDRRLNSPHPGSEMITEIYVPRDRLVDFMEETREDFIRHGVNVIYGTIRLVERDDETFLAWAKQPYACIIFNLHVDHTPEGIARAADAFRRLIDRAIERGGSYFLTYHRYATREQLLACYPQFPEFLRLKRKYDPGETFQSDWYRHYRRLLA